MAFDDTKIDGSSTLPASEYNDFVTYVKSAISTSGNVSASSISATTLSTSSLSASTLTATSADINGGSLDNATIGSSTPSTIKGTTLTANTGIVPDANDGAYLGQAGTAFSDLFLAEGGVINWDSGDATLTQASNVVTLAGAELRCDTTGTDATSAVLVGGTQTLTNKTMTDPTLNYYTGGIFFDAIPNTDHTCNGLKLTLTTAAAFVIGDVGYLNSSGTVTKADASAESSTKGFLVMASGTIASGSSGTFLVDGYIRDDTWAWTIGGELYVSETPGNPTQTKPSTSDAVVRKVGYATSADCLKFHPSDNYIILA